MGLHDKNVEKDQAEIIVCQDNFHGRTTTVVSFSTEPQYRDGFGPFTPGFKFIPYGDAEALRKAITKNTVGFLVEPIQGESAARHCGRKAGRALGRTGEIFSEPGSRNPQRTCERSARSRPFHRD